jgi:carbon monoxide dehydrogenase subunit G
MEITGEQLIPKPQRETWDAICDPAVLQVCIPGCESMEKISDSEFHLTMSAKVGPVSARFKGKITLANVDAPNAYTLIFEGQGGVAGFAKGQADVRLKPEGGATRLEYAAKAMIGGKLAQVGSRLVDGVAKKLAENFFSAFNKHVSGEGVKE